MPTTSTALPQWETYKSDIKTVFIEKNDRPLISWMVAFPVGSYHDPQGKEGLTTFMTQMLLRGTKSRSREQIEETLDYLGTSIDISAGAHSIILEGEILSKNLSPFLDLLLDILSEPVFLEPEIEKQKKEALSQLQLDLESDAKLAKKNFLKSLFPAHPYGRETLGNKEHILTFVKKDLQEHFKKHIHRNQLVIGASGNVTKKMFDKEVSRFYERLPSGNHEAHVLPAKHEKSGRNIYFMDKPDRTQTHFFVGGLGPSNANEDSYALEVFMTAFAGPMFQAQYMNEIRVIRGWSYGAYGKLEPRRDSGSWYLYTFPKVADTLPAIALTLELLNKSIDGQGLPDSAIDFAKKNLIRSFPFEVDLPEKIIKEKIFGHLVNRPDDYLETYTDRIASLTVEEIRSAAKRHLRHEQVTISILGTKKDFNDEELKRTLGADSITTVPYNR